MPSYFHVSEVDHPIGTVLQPGRFGTSMRQIVKGGSVAPANMQVAYSLTWEAVLETARLLMAPNSPSRLNCLFACDTMKGATVFRDKYRAGAFIFQLNVASEVAIHVGDFDLISSTESGPFIDVWSSGAIRYWRTAAKGSHEIIIGGPAKVTKKIPATR